MGVVVYLVGGFCWCVVEVVARCSLLVVLEFSRCFVLRIVYSRRCRALASYNTTLAKVPPKNEEGRNCAWVSTRSTQNHEKQRFSPPKKLVLGIKNRRF